MVFVPAIVSRFDEPKYSSCPARGAPLRRKHTPLAKLVTGDYSLLSWPEAGAGFSNAVGPLVVVLASLCRAIDNNMTRRISATDALFIAGVKGAVAG